MFTPPRLPPFRRARKGAAVVEYVILLALVAGLVLMAALSLGGTARGAYTDADSVLRDNIPLSVAASGGGGPATSPATPPTPPAPPPATPPATPPASPPATPVYAVEHWGVVFITDDAAPSYGAGIFSIGTTAADPFENTVGVVRYTLDSASEMVGNPFVVAAGSEVFAGLQYDLAVALGEDPADLVGAGLEDYFSFSLAPLPPGSNVLMAPLPGRFDVVVNPGPFLANLAPLSDLWQQETDALGSPAWSYDFADIAPDYVAGLCEMHRPTPASGSASGVVEGALYNHGALVSAPAGRHMWALACTSSADPAARAAALAARSHQIAVLP